MASIRTISRCALIFAAVVSFQNIQFGASIRWMALHTIAPRAWTSAVSPSALLGGGSHWRRALKNDFGLSRRQERFCREAPNLLPLLSKAAQTALAACKEAFSDQRWNCSSLVQAPELSPDLTSGTKEQAYVYALSSASVVNVVAKACADGALSDCPCGATPRSPPDGNFKWGGCGDNVAYGVKVSKKFLEGQDRRNPKTLGDVAVGNEMHSANAEEVEEKRRAKQLLAHVNKHNYRAGRRALDYSVTQQCKCHGVSGSCNIKTCWRALTEVQELAQRLKRSYAEATLVALSKRDKKQHRFKIRTQLQPKSPDDGRFGGDDLVFVTASPDYCEADAQFGSFGTRERVCNSSEEARDHSSACANMCCGRGFETKVKETLERCHCRYRWCCYVKCKTCLRTELVSQCL